MGTLTSLCLTSRSLIVPINDCAQKPALQRRMLVQRMNRIVGIVVLLIAACAHPRAVEAQDGVLPRDLADIARKSSCEAVTGFYSRPGMVHPPFVYGVDAGDEEASAAFWCQRPGTRSFLLVVLRANGSQTTIPWMNFPGGLSITQPQDFDLAAFRRVSDPRTAGPSVVIRGASAIRSYYDGVAELFVEHGGEWFVRMID